MAEEKKNGKLNGNGMVCSCGYGDHGRHWTFFLLRALITIIILMIVFWFGVAAGRLSDAGLDRYSMMRYTTGIYAPGGVAMPMMPVNGSTSAPTTGGVQNY